MRIILSRKRQQGLIFLGIIVIVLAVGLGGCAFQQVLQRLNKLDTKLKAQATNNPPEFVFDPVEPVEPPVQNNGNAITTNGATKIDTNWYNPALEDETGF